MEMEIVELWETLADGQRSGCGYAADVVTCRHCVLPRIVRFHTTQLHTTQASLIQHTTILESRNLAGSAQKAISTNVNCNSVARCHHIIHIKFFKLR